ncbi:cyclic nucleotide-gated cation channel alpha-3-like [Asterias rubens]|uniref:cyclic nucleotide-gated cation channel alpha-3-like n=1 Tax=Asterias rubens TaxID=7604 RepID=UPI001455BD37|nr:cyclic nucleotide-gated cation channel alpha-3-like [Asterias rubens]
MGLSLQEEQEEKGSSSNLVNGGPVEKSGQDEDKSTAINMGKLFGNGKIHPVEGLSATDSLSDDDTGDDSEKNGGLSADGKRSSGLWTSLRAAVNFNSAFLAQKKRARKTTTTQRVDSFLEKFTVRQRENFGYDDPENRGDGTDGMFDAEKELPRTYTVDPDGQFNFYWLFVVTIAFEYNIWFAIAREAWPGLQDQGGIAWFILDYVFDFIYLLDILVQFRTGFLDQGILVHDGKQLAKHYAKSWSFAVDLLALTPLDFLYFVDAVQLHPMFRFPRFLKVYRMTSWYYMAEAKATEPNVFRVLNICHVLLLLVHWFAAFYFMLCQRIGFGTGDWVYPSLDGEFNSTARMYLMSFYWSTLTLTLLGDIPVPGSEWEYVFQILSYLIGVIVFATIVGQVGAVIENRNSLRLEFERHVDNAKKYMRMYNVAKDVQNRVLLWYFYTWRRSKTDVNSLGPLPTKIRTELAMHVHLQTLKKVSIFNECPPEFLHDLVLKMATCIYTPGDLVCRKGEVAREMFIIADGLLEVVRPDGVVLTTLKSGDFFGEIGIMNLGGTANRRTADVRSVGYSELFTLCKGDVLAALTDFPQAQIVLEEEARRRLDTSRKSECLIRPMGAADSSCTEASDIDRRAVRAFSKRRTASALGSSRNKLVSSSEPPSPGRESATPLADFSPALSRWSLKPMPLKVSRRKRGSKSSETSRENDNEAWVNDVIGTVQSRLTEKLEQHNKENLHLSSRIRDLRSQLNTKDRENERQAKEIKTLQNRVIELEEKLKTMETVHKSSGDSNNVCAKDEVT